MMYKHSQSILFFLAFAMGLFLLGFAAKFSYAADAKTAAAKPLTATQVAAAQVVWVKGNVKAIGADKVSRILQRRGVVYEHDTLVSATGSSGQIVFSDNTLVSINENTQIKVDEYKYTHGAAPSQDKYIVSVAKGGFRTITGAIGKSNPNNYQVHTPVATIGVRGTQYGIIITNGQIYMKIEVGSINVQTPKGTVNLSQGSSNLYATINMSNPTPVVSSAPPAGANFTEQPPIEKTTSTLPANDTGSGAAPSGGAGGSTGGTSSGGSSGTSGSDASGSTTSATGSDSGTTSTGGTSTPAGSTGGSGAPVSGFCIQ